jgi:hypothetical protein
VSGKIKKGIRATLQQLPIKMMKSVLQYRSFFQKNMHGIRDKAINNAMPGGIRRLRVNINTGHPREAVAMIMLI